MVTNEERDLVLEVSNGMKQVLYHIFYLRTLCEKTKDLNYIECLRWLKKESLVGFLFLDWLKNKHHDSMLLAAADIRKQMTKDFKTQKIFAR